MIRMFKAAKPNEYIQKFISMITAEGIVIPENSIEKVGEILEKLYGEGFEDGVNSQE